jgi:hypothetical protein
VNIAARVGKDVMKLSGLSAGNCRDRVKAGRRKGRRGLSASFTPV